MLDSQTASGHGTPVYITVWDLSPPSTWSSAASGWFGLGIFHTNVWFPDLSVEWAYGGHGYRDISGVFSLPRDPTVSNTIHEQVLATESSALEPLLSNPPETLDGLSLLGPEKIPAPGLPPLPDARYMGAYFIGYAGSVEAHLAAQSSSAVQPWACPKSGGSAFKEPEGFTEPYFARAASILSSASVSRAAAAKSQLTPIESTTLTRAASRHPRHRGQRLLSVTFVQKTLQALRTDPEWAGPRYDLLTHNCNHFTDAVCKRLTGSGIPSWINRTAALGRNVLWAVPKSILDIDTGVPLEDDVFSDLGSEAGAEAEAEVEASVATVHAAVRPTL